MQHVAKLELCQRAIRSQVCVKCYQRPPESELMASTEPRICEPTCPIFDNLPKLIGLSVRPATLASTDTLIRNAVCQTCKTSSSAGDFCAEHLARTCPLSRYGQDVVAVLQRTCQT